MEVAPEQESPDISWIGWPVKVGSPGQRLPRSAAVVAVLLSEATLRRYARGCKLPFQAGLPVNTSTATRAKGPVQYDHAQHSIEPAQSVQSQSGEFGHG